MRPAVKKGKGDTTRCDEEDSHSSQLDIIVYDKDRYPIYEKFNEFVIVPPEGVIAVISIKKSLRSASMIKDECDALLNVRSLFGDLTNQRLPYQAIVGMQSETKYENLDTVFNVMKRVYQSTDVRDAVNLISDLSSWTIDGNYYAWELDKVISQDGYVKFFNFNKKLFLNCEEQRYEGAVLYKTGRCVPLVDMNILQIHEMFSERKHAISDYIIIPSEFINPDSWLGVPVNWTGKEIYETICAVFLKNGMRVKNCNLCTFGRKNKNPYEVKPLYCYRHRCACNAGDAMKCEEFQIGDGNIRTLTNDKQLVKIIEKAWKEYRLKG